MPPAAAQVQIKYISSGHGCLYFKDNIRQTICQYIVPKSIKCIYKCLRLCYTFSVQKTVQIQSEAGVDAVCGVPSHKGDRICKKKDLIRGVPCRFKNTDRRGAFKRTQGEPSYSK